MSMSAFQADASLAALTSSFVVLHTGSPGAAGTGNVALNSSDAAMTPKAASFAAVENHPTNIERRRLTDAAIAFSAIEAKAAQEITHVSIWDGSTGPGTDDPLHIAALAEPKTIGSDGCEFAAGDIECAVEVFAKP